jgi:hypothetical protein
VQGGIVAITGVVAVVGLIGGALLLAIPKIVAFKRCARHPQESRA